MALMWFRSDLRIDDNAALLAALENKATTAVFIATHEQWQRHDVAPIQINFVKRHLALLGQQLAKAGIKLHILLARDFNDQIKVLKNFCREHCITTVYANKEIEFNECQRDSTLANDEIKLILSECDTIVNKGKLLNLQGEMFKVFTPFSKAWLKYVGHSGVALSLSARKLSERYDGITENTNIDIEEQLADFPHGIDSSHWSLANEFKKTLLPVFLAENIYQYQQKRDFPFSDATSKLSPYLAIGAISARTLACQVIQSSPEVLESKNHPAFAWLNELIWRDFYRHLLFHFPRLSRGATFNQKYRNLPWRNSERDFHAWCNGETGYPLVDAAMKQLVQTGWMHNRLRMVVASFLTKHLLIHWKKGEAFFKQHLIDGDLAANNGGWQWAASTGCDAQPYFRVFNPILQSKRFDPKGDFIRKYIPELKNIPDKEIHFPHKYILQHNQGLLETINYPLAIVEHKFARERAISFFKDGF